MSTSGQLRLVPELLPEPMSVILLYSRLPFQLLKFLLTGLYPILCSSVYAKLLIQLYQSESAAHRGKTEEESSQNYSFRLLLSLDPTARAAAPTSVNRLAVPLLPRAQTLACHPATTNVRPRAIRINNK